MRSNFSLSVLVDMAVSDDILKSIGQLTLQCTEVESNIEMGIWLLMNTDRGPFVTAHMPFPQKRDVLLALAKSKFENETDTNRRLEHALNRTTTLFGKRNKFVHSTWSQEDNDPTIATMLERSVRGTYKVSSTNVTVPEIESLINELEELEVEFAKIYMAYGIWSPSSPDK